MEDASLDPLVAFSWLVSELLGRAVNACIDDSSVPSSANPLAYKRVTLELAQTAQRPGQILLKVSDEGHGLPDTLKSVKQTFAPLQRALASSCVSHDAGLLLRTTNFHEKTIRRYHACSSISNESTHSTTFEVVKIPVEEEKLPGMQLSGTQATLIFSSSAIPPEAALAACQQLLSMLSTLCPPVHLVLKAQDLLLQSHNKNEEGANVLQQTQKEEASQAGSATSTATTTTDISAASLSSLTPTTFTRQLEPLPSTSLLSYMQRLRTGLLAEFPSSVNGAAIDSAAASVPSPAETSPPLLTFVGVGEGAVPRGCKWNACAGVVLQLPDHSALVAAAESRAAVAGQHDSQNEDRVENNTSAAAAAVPTPAYLFKSHAVQFADNDNYIDALRRVNWTGHGFKLLKTVVTENREGEVENEVSVEPVAVLLQCEQPESMAGIPAIVVHLYYSTANSTTQAPQYGSQIDSSINTTTGSSQQQQQQQVKIKNAATSSWALPPKLAPLHQRTLIRSAIDAALADLKHQCPNVMSDRRDRSLTRALPVVSSAVAGILTRAVDEGVLVEACQALRVREVSELADVLHRRLEETVIFAQQQQQRVGEEGASGEKQPSNERRC